ncbi:hypothetical protein ACTXG7_24855 [Mycolicibacterium sp. Dal123E01]|uniref:hypothetical protein n=1 Tax=Mycolicibacterium sp. Dal123E01 TaxID=3457578 RepID=UPI00403EAF16
MGVKEEARLERISITQRPSTTDLLDQIISATHMSKSDIYNVGVDVLHFVWTVLSKGGTIGVKFPDDTEYRPVNIFIPGMTKPTFDAQQR